MDVNNEADIEVEIVACNCGSTPLRRQRHQFRFDSAQPVPCSVVADSPNSIQMGLDDASHKLFYVVFAQPIPPGGTKRYVFRFRATSAINGELWDFPAASGLVNHYVFELFQETPKRLSSASAEWRWDEGNHPIPTSVPSVVQLDTGILINWHFSFPEPETTYRVSWKFHPDQRSRGQESE